MGKTHNLRKQTKIAMAVADASICKRSISARSAMAGLMLTTAVLAPAASIAQTAQGQNIEEVVVTGIRSSLKRAMDIKKDARGIVDAISAEDMGVFPDTNLAESLQRITGVSIDRSRGEGSKVTVRGFGPEFNLVTLNGRQMPTHDGDNRSFDFADLASEGIAGVQVYKSGNADTPTGGIGSTINIQTAKPLDAPGLKSVVSFKAVNDQSTSKGDSLTPELSGMFSNTFADDTIGIAISGSYQKRDNGVNTATVGDYNYFQGTADDTNTNWGGLPRNEDQINRPADSSIYAVPQSMGYELAEFSRERLNGQLALQWQASENIRTTVDYTFSEVDFERTFNNYSGWYNFSGNKTEYSNGPVASPLVFTEISSAADFAMAAGRDGVKTQNDSIGLNLEWQINDRLGMAFDFHDSVAKSGANGSNGTSSQLAIASFTRERTTVYFGGDLPILNLGLSGPLDTNDAIVTGSVFDNKATEMNIQQTKISGEFSFSENSSIDFGVQFTNVDNTSQFANVQRNTWGGTTQPGDIADLLTPASSAGVFDQISNGGDQRRQTDFFVFDIDALAARTEELGATQSLGGDCGTGLCASSNFTTDRRTSEETTSLYVQLNHEFDIGDFPANFKAGLRYEDTDVDSSALVPTYSSIKQTGDNELEAIQATDSKGQPIQDFTRVKGQYDFLLPNLDLKVSFTNDLVARVSYSETISRPSFIDIQGGLTIEPLLRVSGGNGTSGNPNLLPFESQNIDLSLEYYFGDADYVSAGFFKKDVENFIGTATLQDQVLFPDLIMPTTGESATFDVKTPVNQEKATIDGFEFAVQKSFGDSGFGIIANMTIVDGDVAYNNESLDTQFVLKGLSDSANLIGFYENERMQVRAAYNWRDDFYDGLAGAATGTPGPVNVEAYGQFDISASFNIKDNLTVFLEGINITEETTRSFGRSELLTIQTAQTGARWNLGVRYEF